MLRSSGAMLPWLASLLATSFTPGVQSNSLFLASMCKEHECNTPEHPMLEYDTQQNTCVCSAHPCWDDNGLTHACSGDDFPFLTFAYKEDGTLECACSNHAKVDSVFIANEKCRSHKCDDGEHPVLDVDDNGDCVCRSNPCLDDKGERHSCDVPDYPILSYRQDANGNTVCGCKAKFHKPSDGNGAAGLREFSSIPKYNQDDDDDDDAPQEDIDDNEEF